MYGKPTVKMHSPSRQERKQKNRDIVQEEKWKQKIRMRCLDGLRDRRIFYKTGLLYK